MKLNKNLYNLYKESGINVLEMNDLNKAINIYENIPENENIVTKTKINLDLELIILELKNKGMVNNNEEKLLRLLPLSVKIKKIEKLMNEYSNNVINIYLNNDLLYNTDVMIDKFNNVKINYNYIDKNSSGSGKTLDDLRKQKIKLLRKSK